MILFSVVKLRHTNKPNKIGLIIALHKSTNIFTNDLGICLALFSFIFKYNILN